MQTSARPAYVLLAIGSIAAVCAVVFSAFSVLHSGIPNVAPIDAATAARIRTQVDAALAGSASLRRQEIDEEPAFRASSCGAPHYPANAVRDHHQGTTMLRVLIATEGTAKAIETEKTSGFAELDAAAIRSVKCWRFTPKVKAGRALDSWAIVPIKFSMSDM